MALVSGSADVLQLLSQAGPNLFIVQVNKGPNPFNVRGPNWTVDQVAVKLVQMGVPKDDARILQRQDVDGETLAYITEDSLTKLGVATFGRRVKILRSVQQMLAPYTAEPGSMSSQSSTRPVSSLSRPLTAQRQISSPLDDDDDEPVDRRSRFSSTAPQQQFSQSGASNRFRSSDRERSSSPVARSNANDFQADEQTSDNEVSDDEREREYVRPAEARAQQKSQARSSGAPMGDDDDLFGTTEAAAAAEFMAVKPWLGAIVAPTRPPSSNPAAPEKHLRLEWAHGYRSIDSRSNLFYNAQHDIVYPVAGIVVVYSTKSKRQKHFMGHNDDIRCLAQHPKNTNLFASGQNSTVVKGSGAPPFICVWDSTDFTKNSVLKFTQQDRAVRAVCFTGDGRYVLSVSNDDNHTVKVWDWEKKALITTAKGDNNPIYNIRGNHKDPREIVTVGKRHAVFWTFDGVKLTGKKAQVGSKDVSFFSVAFSEKGYACLGADDGGIYVYVGGKPAKVFPNIHKGKVFTLDWYAGGIISGGSDNKVNILDKKMEVAKKFSFSNKITSVHVEGDDLLVGTQGSEVFEVQDYPNTEVEDDKKLEAITRGHCDGELWALAITPDGKYFVSAGEDNTIALWDVAGHKQIRKGIISDKKGKAPAVKKASTTSTFPVNQCSRAIAISPNGKHIIIGCNNGEVTVFDSRTMQKLLSIDLNKFGKRNVKDQTGNWIEVIQFSPSGQSCAVGTHGSVVVLLDVAESYKPKGLLKGSNSFITAIDWSADGRNIQTNDGAYELLFYNVDENDLKSASQNTNATALRDVKWMSQTCKLGWAVQGIYDPSQSGDDINTCDASASRSLIATGDDSGNVNLFRYPALKGHKSVSSHAHSSHVVTVRFSPDEKYVLSTGGHDLSIMQWAVTSN